MASKAQALEPTQGGLGSSATLARLLLLALVTTMGFTALGSFGTIQESAKAELGLSDDALALIQGLGAAVPMVLFSIPVGILVDRRNRVRLTIGLAILWSVGTLLTAFATNAFWLTASRMLVGIGSTGSLTAALSLCADFCAPAQRGRAMLIVNLGKALGVALGFALTGWLFGQLSITNPFGPSLGMARNASDVGNHKRAADPSAAMASRACPARGRGPTRRAVQSRSRGIVGSEIVSRSSLCRASRRGDG